MSIKKKIMGEDEVRDLIVGRMERHTAGQVERGEISPSEARLLVGAADSSFKYLIEVAAEEGIEFVRAVKTAHRWHGVRCTESNTIPVAPEEYEGMGFCGACGCLAHLKQNGRLPVHWRGDETMMGVMRKARGW